MKTKRVLSTVATAAVLLILSALPAMAAVPEAPSASGFVGRVTNLKLHDHAANPRSVRLDWGAATNATTYLVEIMTHNYTGQCGAVGLAGCWQEVYRGSATEAVHAESNRPLDPIYKGSLLVYRVAALNSSGKQGAATHVTGYAGRLGSATSPRKPTKPRSLALDTLQTGYPGFILEWSHPWRGGVYGYLVARKAAGSTAWKTQPAVAGKAIRLRTYHIPWGGTGSYCLEQDVSYTYRITPVGHGGYLGNAATISGIKANADQTCGNNVG